MATNPFPEIRAPRTTIPVEAPEFDLEQAKQFLGLIANIEIDKLHTFNLTDEATNQETAILTHLVRLILESGIDPIYSPASEAFRISQLFIRVWDRPHGLSSDNNSMAKRCAIIFTRVIGWTQTHGGQNTVVELFKGLNKALQRAYPAMSTLGFIGEKSVDQQMTGTLEGKDTEAIYEEDVDAGIEDLVEQNRVEDIQDLLAGFKVE